MKKQNFTFPPKRYYLIMSIIGSLVFVYLVRVVSPLIALAHHQNFVGLRSEQSQFAAQMLETAIRFDRKNSQYRQELGMHLHHSSVELLSLDDPQQKLDFQHAEASLKRSVILNPGDPWNYYELARLSLSRGYKSDAFVCSSLENIERCLPGKYFLTALQKAPNNLFLRRTAGRWLYDIAPENAFGLLQSIFPETSENSQENVLKLSKFLYDIRKDYESDLQYQRLHEGSASELICGSANILSAQILETEKQKIIELGSDDGSAEWRTFLASETARSKKIICLPDKVENYTHAALKILMNHVGSKNFIAWIYIDGQLIKKYERDIPRQKQWYEIPFDPKLLYGKTFVNVYIRVAEASYRGGNYLQIWADSDSTTGYSSRDYHQTDDLSADKGFQSGEYMIRLLLKKSYDN